MAIPPLHIPSVFVDGVLRLVVWFGLVGWSFWVYVVLCWDLGFWEGWDRRVG